MGCGASTGHEGVSPLDVDRTPSARRRVERSLSCSVRGETAVRLEGYDVRGTLGYGAFARVLEARHIESGEDRALKVIERGVLRRKKTMKRSGSGVTRVSSALDKLDAEILLQKEFAHSHIIRIFEVVEDPVQDRILLVMELASQGPVMAFDAHSRLFSCVVSGEAVESDRAARYVAELASALSYLHMRHVAHRDLKPDNILLDKGDAVKLCDFGVSHTYGESLGGRDRDSLDYDRNVSGVDRTKRLKAIGRSGSTAQVKGTEGTYAYWAPEMMNEKGESFNAFACDCWALGVCFYNFRTRLSPFESETLDGLFDRISRADRDPCDLSAIETTLLDGLLAADPARRLTVSDLGEDPHLLKYARHEERRTQFRTTPRDTLSKRGSLRGGFAGNTPRQNDGLSTPMSTGSALSELATLQTENPTPA